MDEITERTWKMTDDLRNLKMMSTGKIEAHATVDSTVHVSASPIVGIGVEFDLTVDDAYDAGMQLLRDAFECKKYELGEQGKIFQLLGWIR